MVFFSYMSMTVPDFRTQRTKLFSAPADHNKKNNEWGANILEDDTKANAHFDAGMVDLMRLSNFLLQVVAKRKVTSTTENVDGVQQEAPLGRVVMKMDIEGTKEQKCSIRTHRAPPQSRFENSG
jgi:NAD-dependent SIR2 family protein deacetylase